MKKKVTVHILQEYTFEIDDEYCENMEMTEDEAIEYNRESLEIYGEDRLDALQDSRCISVSVNAIEDM
jgi:hypothetical protein